LTATYNRWISRIEGAITTPTGSDHFPIETTIDVEAPAGPPPPERPQWKNADWDKVKKELEKRLTLLVHHPYGTRMELDALVGEVHQTIQDTVKATVPVARPSPKASPAWSEECTEAVKEARQLFRRWRQSNQIPDFVSYRKAHNMKKRAIRKEKSKLWRKAVEEITANPKGVWRLAKWARTADGKPKALPQFPPISRPGEEQLHHNDEEKAIILAEQFFPPPAAADLSDIPGFEYQEPKETRMEVEEGDIIAALKGLAPDKAPGPTKITNRFLKTCGEQLAPLLARIFNRCLEIGYHPKPFKDSITVVLRKPQKPSYTTAKAYRPIALLDTIGKLLERIVATRLSAIAEATGMLPEGQMGARPGRSTQTALELLTQQVHTVWKANPNLVVSLLNLDISGAFDRVSHERMIHNMKVQGVPVDFRYIEQLRDATGSAIGGATRRATGAPQSGSGGLEAPCSQPPGWLYIARRLRPPR